MSKYQVTNAQYAAFLNAKHAEGVLEYGVAYPFKDAAYLTGSTGEPLVRDCNSMSKWGITRNSSDGTWSPVSGYENHPVIYLVRGEGLCGLLRLQPSDRGTMGVCVPCGYDYGLQLWRYGRRGLYVVYRKQ